MISFENADVIGTDRCLQDQRYALLDFAIKHMRDGEVLEFGVYRGYTIKHIADQLPQRQVFGFDSFNGLPESWKWNDEITFPQHTFKVSKPLLPPNIELVEGLFQDTLEHWIKTRLKNKPVALVHLDCDLYSSTKYVLDTLNDNLVTGTIIVFDDLCDWEGNYKYSNWPEHQWKAMMEWSEEKRRSITSLGRTQGAQGAIRVFR